jgi:hypothetical protein
MPEQIRDRAALIAFFALAYILSWTFWIPSVLLYPPPSEATTGHAALLLHAALAAVAWPWRRSAAARSYHGVQECDTEAAFRV